MGFVPLAVVVVVVELATWFVLPFSFTRTSLKSSVLKRITTAFDIPLTGATVAPFCGDSIRNFCAWAPLNSPPANNAKAAVLASVFI
jgi:hypothetical protein